VPSGSTIGNKLGGSLSHTARISFIPHNCRFAAALITTKGALISAVFLYRKIGDRTLLPALFTNNGIHGIDTKTTAIK
jgi:hypothetical protein